jgi:hypothetical protein
MNIMYAHFAGGTLSQTDYFESRDRDAGRAWLVMESTSWHVLLPHPCAHPPSLAYARPVTDSQEWEGWRWRLELGGWHLPLPRAQIIGPRPRLPDPYTRTQRTLTLYDSVLRAAAGQSFFGNLRIGIQICATCPLHLVRETRHGEKRLAHGTASAAVRRRGGGRFP